MIHLHHASVTLALHPLSRGDGLPLLLLPALGASAAQWRALPVEWDGPVYALDYCGHGESQWLKGGGYTPELFVADADTALARIGSAAVAGIGLGAYVGLLLSGVRGEEVPATLLLPGVGLVGGPPLPDFTRGYRLAEGRADVDGCDPLVWTVDSMVRPPAYADELGRGASRLLLAEDDGERPEWWQVLCSLRQAQSVSTDLGEAFRRLAEACD